MATKIQLRGDTAANWASVNPVLSEREMVLETDTNKYKIGDGVTAYNALAYASLPVDVYTKDEADAMFILRTELTLESGLYYINI